MYKNIESRAKELEEYLLTWQKDFHEHPELGWCEFRTASRLAAELKCLGYHVLKNFDRSI